MSSAAVLLTLNTPHPPLQPTGAAVHHLLMMTLTQHPSVSTPLAQLKHCAMMGMHIFSQLITLRLNVAV